MADIIELLERRDEGALEQLCAMTYQQRAAFIMGKFLDDYYKKKIFESDPFARVDQEGVGRLMQIAADLGRKTRPNLKMGICGEHGGDPSSIEFCHKIGLNYVSCSPFRVPIARLAAAQAKIKADAEAEA